MIAYLDIETALDGSITVIGLWRPPGEVVQLVGPAVTAAGLREQLGPADVLCTFNGDGFDLPVIKRRLGVDLLMSHRSLDLSVECRRSGVRGGLKRVEASFSIPRRSKGMGGLDAMTLWRRWEQGDLTALRSLLRYNREDVLNLRDLERRLAGDLGTSPAPLCRVVGVEDALGVG